MARRAVSNVKRAFAAAEETESRRFSRVIAVIIALENYRKPSNSDALPSVSFAHADADAIADTVREIFKDMPASDIVVEIIKDSDASLIAVRDHLSYTIRNLAEGDLFIFYYAGHGFHGSGGNRLSTYDTNRNNVTGTSLLMGDDLLVPLAKSECNQALVFVDACAEQFRDVVESRDVITNLEAEEVEQFFDSSWYLGVFLSCSPGEKSYPAAILGHGIWTYFLLEALAGRAERALTCDRWLTDAALRDYLRREVPRYITRETSIRGTHATGNCVCFKLVQDPPHTARASCSDRCSISGNPAKKSKRISGRDGDRRYPAAQWISARSSPRADAAQ